MDMTIKTNPIRAPPRPEIKIVFSVVDPEAYALVKSVVLCDDLGTFTICLAVELRRWLVELVVLTYNTNSNSVKVVGMSKSGSVEVVGLSKSEGLEAANDVETASGKSDTGTVVVTLPPESDTWDSKDSDKVAEAIDNKLDIIDEILASDAVV
jgi:hypothetical protein